MKNRQTFTTGSRGLPHEPPEVCTLKGVVNLTDFSLNCMVAKAAGIGQYMFFCKEHDFDKEELIRGPVWQIPSGEEIHGFISSKGNVYSPVSDIKDLWPIMVSNNISLDLEDGEPVAYNGCKFGWEGEVVSYDYSYSHTNPNRAVVVVFLMMQGYITKG